MRRPSSCSVREGTPVHPIVDNDVHCTSTQLMSPDVSGWPPENAGPEPRVPLNSPAAYGETTDPEA